MNKNRIIALAIAASALSGNIVFAQSLTNEVPQKIMPRIIGIKQNNGVRTFIFNRQINGENEYAKVAVKLPLILGMKDWKYQMQLNNALMSQAMKDKQNVEETGKTQVEEAKKNGWPIRPSEMDIKYEVKKNSDILSITVSTYIYNGGANGSTRVDTYNIDLRENKSISLSDLFNGEADFKSAINSEISTQIETRTKDGEMFFDGNMGFTTISDNQMYYLQDDDLVILFQKYEIAPGAMGTPEFRIPLKNLNHLLRKPINSEQSPEKPESGKKQVAFKAFTGTVKEIRDFQAETGRKYVAVESESGEQATIVISDNTYVVNKVEITEGTVITGYYDATAPMIMIYPPQYSAEVVEVVEKGQNIKVDKFDENLLSSDLWLKLNISDKTEIISQDGKAYDGNLKNKNLVVFYDVTTKSIPAQTTPTKIVVLLQKGNSK